MQEQLLTLINHQKQKNQEGYNKSKGILKHQLITKKIKNQRENQEQM